MADQKPFPILFITSTRIGDAVLSSGLLKRLHDEIPRARFTIAAGPLALPLFRDTPRLDALIPMEKQSGGRHWLSLWQKVRRTRWGLVLDVRGSGIANLVATKTRAVYRRPPDDAPVRHKVQELAALLKLEDDPPAPYLFVGHDTQGEADGRLGEGGPLLAVAPGANWVGKTWPAERYAILAARLLGREGPLPEGRLLLIGGPEDKRASEAVRRELPRKRVIDVTAELDLLTVMLKRVRLFVGADSGLMHLAAAAGAPTLGLFGPSDERRYGPWGPHARALRGPRGFDHYKSVDPQLNQSLSHMSDLSVERVLSGARRLIVDTEPAATVEPAEPAEPGEPGEAATTESVGG